MRGRIAAAAMLAAGSALGAAGAAEAKITRQCTVEYIAKIGPEQNKILIPGAFSAGPRGRVLDSFKTQAGCGRGVPNRCRRRARDTAASCARAHFDRPLPLPAQCAPGAGVIGYSGVSPFTRFIRALCCASPEAIAMKPTYFGASLTLKISGDTGCGYGKISDPSGAKRDRHEEYLFRPHTLSCANYSCG